MRSLMFVPGHRQRMVDRALGLGEFTPGGLDVALLDLEDGVAASEKGTARSVIGGSLGRQSNGQGPLRFVRMNALRVAERRDPDLDAIVCPGLDGIVAPKVDSVEDIYLLAGLLDEREVASGLAQASVKIIAAIESATGLLNAPAIASASPRVIGLMFGAEDFALDIGLATLREYEASELLYARSALVVAAAAARKLSFDGVWPDIGDADGLRNDGLRARRLGFSGKTLIHPDQVEVINAVFSPNDPEVDYARRVLVAFDEAQARGDGAVAMGGQLLDPPIVERARRTLELNAALHPGAGQ
jgi:citrate lyase subunit beta/citryl-CoA lyase